MNVPVTALTILGILIAILGLFTGGGVELLALGLGAIAVAAILQVIDNRRR